MKADAGQRMPQPVLQVRHAVQRMQLQIPHERHHGRRFGIVQKTENFLSLEPSFRIDVKPFPGKRGMPSRGPKHMQPASNTNPGIAVPLCLQLPDISVVARGKPLFDFLH